jgi:hypothetical protein
VRRFSADNPKALRWVPRSYLSNLRASRTVAPGPRLVCGQRSATREGATPPSPCRAACDHLTRPHFGLRSA